MTAPWPPRPDAAGNQDHQRGADREGTACQDVLRARTPGTVSARCPNCRHELPSTLITEWVAAALELQDLVVRLAMDEEERGGLLAVCVARSGPYVINGIAVRRTHDGKTIVTWPAKPKRGAAQRWFSLRSADQVFRARCDAVVMRAYIAARAKAGRTDR